MNKNNFSTFCATKNLRIGCVSFDINDINQYIIFAPFGTMAINGKTIKNIAIKIIFMLSTYPIKI